ncbi:AAA family ATPase [Paradevosia shaoguanensis]|uniref:AAA family ATPase n=1 Tax=Paradevosia shaoguanensis TaxID=1335043 RepID=UPI001932CE14|nr:AAA family ATPase [Paradevosia shaoguanensis]
MTYVESQADVGSEASLIRSFSIENLYGYRTVSFASEFAATVIIAKNGSGKTTLIGAMNAFLSRQFGRLRDLKFETIRCSLRGIDEEIVLNSDELNSFLSAEASDVIYSNARRWELEPRVLLTFLLDDFGAMRIERPIDTDHPVFGQIYRAQGYRTHDAIAACEKVYQALLDDFPKIAQIVATLDQALKDVELVYLPTYRRVELPLVDKEPGHRRSKRKRFFPGHGLFTGDIQFGLSDISEHLRAINEEILFESNRGYRTISANIINELMDGTFDKFTYGDEQLPSKEELQLFLSRLKDGREARMFPPVYDISIPDIANLSAQQNNPSNKFLIYFLSKLDKVISVTREKERKVQEFVDSCNKYLSLRDLSTSFPNDSPPENIERAIDSKELKLNRRNLRLHVASVPWGKKILLDALSSGEKQMISLFAKLYLYPKEKIILVDEPELSLSIDWQRNILVDVLRSPYCKQVIAITHSPFVFDNELEPYAKALKVRVDEQALARFDDESELDADADLSE